MDSRQVSFFFTFFHVLVLSTGVMVGFNLTALRESGRRFNELLLAYCLNNNEKRFTPVIEVSHTIWYAFSNDVPHTLKGF